jgi:hypothetical protein
MFDIKGAQTFDSDFLFARVWMVEQIHLDTDFPDRLVL